MYEHSEHLYDAIYASKDYPTEVERLDAVIRERLPDARTILDVARGTGKHLELLRGRGYEVADVVYTGRGAIYWLPDIRRWAHVAAHFVKPGGILYIYEIHPVVQALDDESSDLRLRYPYFEHVEPLAFDVHGSYADPTAEVEHDKEYGWSHGLGEIVSALAEAGLRIEVVREFPWCDSKMIAILEQRDDGRWWLPHSISGELPLMFPLRARKQA